MWKTDCAVLLILVIGISRSFAADGEPVPAPAGQTGFIAADSTFTSAATGSLVDSGSAGADEQFSPTSRAVPDEESSETESSALRFSVEGTYLFGDIHGSLQTPAGGRPGTTTRRHPTFGEIGIHDLNIADIGGNVGFGPHEIYAGAQFIRPAGDAVLGVGLVTNGVSFPAGTRVRSSVDLDWYRLGYRYRWIVERGDGRTPELSLFPSIGGAIWTYDYHLSGDGLRAGRVYSKALPQLGLELDWFPGGGPLGFSVGAMGFPQIASIPSLAVEQASIKYRLFPSAKLDIEASLGVRWEQINYQDSQRVPNRIAADLGPLLQAGLSIGF